MPFLLPTKSSVLYAADEFGNFYSWKYQDDMIQFILNNYHTHSSQIERLTLSNDESTLFTLSSQDAALCQWNVNILEIEDVPKLDIESFYKAGIEGTSEAICRELQYSYFCQLGDQKETNNAGSGILVGASDNKGDLTVLVKGLRNKQMNDILVAENMEEQLDPVLKPPIGSLLLERIIGVQCGNRRSTIKYYHGAIKNEATMPPTPSEKGFPFHPTLSIGESPPKLPLGEPKTSLKCNKWICYYASRYVIIEDPVENAQFIYDSHKARITCFVIHPSGTIIASGECSQDSSQNTVHVWDANTREPIVILKTVHETGIACLDFSDDGRLLLTFGSGKQSLQIFNWEQEREIAFRHLSTTPILDIKFDPTNANHIIAIGLECIIEIMLTSGSLSIVNIIPMPSTTPQKRIFTCMDFIQYTSASVRVSNAFIGSSLGDIGVLSGSKFSLIQHMTHDGAVNVIKVSRVLLKPFCILTAGDDNKIKIWDSLMGCLASIPVSGFDFYKDPALASETGFQPDFGGVQSLDICTCTDDKPYLLIGMRNGDVSETEMSLKTEEDKSAATPSLMESRKVKFTMNTAHLMGEHNSQGMREDERKLCIALHPTLHITATGGYDGILRFWNAKLGLLLKTYPMGKKMKISAIKFSPNGAILIVGLSNGAAIFFSFNENRNESNKSEFEPQIEKIFSTRDARGTVLLIKFSYNAELLAISYDAEVVAVANPAGEKIEAKQGRSCVVVYAMANSSRMSGAQKSKEPYAKLFQITFPLAHLEAEHPSILSGNNQNVLMPTLEGGHDTELSRAFTHMDFSMDNSLLQLCYMPVSLHGKVDYSKSPLCLVWDLNNCQVVEDWERLRKIDWNKWSLAPIVYSRILGNKLCAMSQEEELELLPREEVVFSNLNLFGRNEELVCAGSRDGDLHLFRFSALLRPNEAISGIKNEVIMKDKMEIAKSYSACCSSIEDIEVFVDSEQCFMLVSSASDEVILKYRFMCENSKWDLDYFNLNEERVDPYSELPPPERFDLIRKECWLPRSRIFELSEKLAPPPHPCDIRTNWIYGRRAYDRRNNLILDYMQRVVYTAGTMLVMLSENNNEDNLQEMTSSLKKLQKTQHTLPATRSVAAFTSPEISCICASNDRHLIALGTAEAKAHIYVWNISHDTEVGTISLPNICVVYCMRFNENKRHLACIGINKDFRQVILLTDIKLQEIISMNTLLHASPYKIRDIEFYPHSETRFVTSGIQHLTFWKVTSKYMEGKNAEFLVTKFKQPEDQHEEAKFSIVHNNIRTGAGKVCLPEQLVEAPDTDPDAETVYVTFMAIGFIDNTMITAGDDGHIYVWDYDKILKKKKAHEDCITCMQINQDLELITTGGNDGYVMVWGFTNAHEPLNRDIVQKASIQVPTIAPVTTFLKPISTVLGATVLPAGNCVQSVWTSKDVILLGTRNGAVHAVDIKASAGEFKIKPQMDGSSLRKVVDATDDEIPKCIAFDARNKRLLCISQRGFLSVWDLESNSLIAIKQFDKQANYIYAFSGELNTLVGFENEVNMLNDQYYFIESFSIKKSVITAIKISNNEKFLALASSNTKSPELEIYDIENKFHEFHSIKGYKSNIIAIDFTKDDKYMICQDELGDTYLYDRERLERISGELEEDAKLIWHGFGLTIDPAFTEVSKFYNDTNKICAISRFPGKDIVAVGDQLGSVFFYNKVKKLVMFV